MPAAAFVPLAVAGIGALAQHSANKTTAKSSADALQFERDQEAERKREYDAQVAAQKAKYEALNKLAEPYRMAGASVLAKYGFRAPADVPPPTPPPMGAPMSGAPTPVSAPPMIGATPDAGPAPADVQTAMSTQDSTSGPQINLSNLQDWSNWNNLVRRG